MFHDNPQQDVSDLFRNYQQRQDNFLITGLSGASRVQLCAICRQPGHNSANCPQKENDPDYCSLVDHDSPELNSRITARKSKLLAIRDATIKELKSKQNRIRAEFIHTEITKGKNLNPDDSLDYLGSWFENQDKLSKIIIEALRAACGDISVLPRHILIQAQPGVGKTLLMEAIAYLLVLGGGIRNHLSRELLVGQLRTFENAFLLTGLSSKDFEPDMKRAMHYFRPENIFHRNSLTKKKEFIKRINEKPELLDNAVFFIDEARLVIQKSMTLDKLWQLFGLNEETIIDRNILFFYIDATPQGIQHIFESKLTRGKLFFMNPGNNYFGNERMLRGEEGITFHNIVANSNNDVATQGGREGMVRHILSTGEGVSIFRIENKKNRNEFIDELKKHEEEVEYFVDTNVEHHSHDWELFNTDGKKMLFEEATNLKLEGKHRVFILIQKYPCSKRFRYNKVPKLRIIYDSRIRNKKDDTSTQGIHARFWGYYAPEELDKLSIDCYGCKEHFERYKEYIDSGGVIPNGYDSKILDSGNKYAKKTLHYHRLNGSDVNQPRYIENVECDYNNGIIYHGDIAGNYYKTGMLSKNVTDITHPSICKTNYNNIIDEHDRLYNVNSTENDELRQLDHKDAPTKLANGEYYSSLEDLEERVNKLATYFGQSLGNGRWSYNTQVGYAALHSLYGHDGRMGVQSIARTSPASTIPPSNFVTGAGGRICFRDSDDTFKHRVYSWKFNPNDHNEGYKYLLLWKGKKEALER